MTATMVLCPASNEEVEKDFHGPCPECGVDVITQEGKIPKHQVQVARRHKGKHRRK